MKKSFALLLFCLLLYGAARADVLVVSVNGENQAALLDPATYQVLARLPTGVNPHDIAVSADGRWAYIAVMGTPQEPGHTVTVLDLKQRLVKTTLELNPYRQCHDLRVSRNGARLWASCAPSQAVIEIDTRSGKIIRNWKLKQEGAWMLVVTPDERKIYTANLEGKSVSIIDRRANTVRTLSFDSSQIGIDVSPNGREVWVHHAEKREVSVIDVATDKVIASLPSGGQGFGRVKFTPDGKYVLVPQSESKNVAVFDAATRALLANIPLSAAPKVMAVAPDSKRAIITAPAANLAMVVDLVARKEASTFPTGKTPDGIAWAVTPLAAQSHEPDRLSLFAIERQRGAAWDARLPMNKQPQWNEHARFMNRLTADGIIERGGPLASGEEVLLIVKAKDEAQARAVFDDDPWSKSQLLIIKSARRWTILLQGGDEAAIREILRHYLQAHITGDPEHLKRAFHPDAKLVFVRDGKLAQMTLAEYAARFSGKPADDEAQRKRAIESIEIDGNAAIARMTFDYPATFTTDFILLLKLDGAWRIVSKSFHVRAKPKPTTN